jgi:hypothetical protein
MGETTSPRQTPKAIIHKRILDQAETNPDASIEALADDIAGASPDLVERVLDDFGDPAADTSESLDESATGTDDEPPVDAETDRETEDQEPDETEPDTVANSHSTAGTDPEVAEPTNESPMSETPSVDVTDLSDKQRTALEAIAQRPEATQAELAEQFDVSRATICNWVNSIDSFDWEDRREFVQQAVRTDAIASDGGQAHVTAGDDRLATLQDRVIELEQRLEDRMGSEPAFSDSELVAKIVRACLDDERITEDEEVEILGTFLRG